MNSWLLRNGYVFRQGRLAREDVFIESGKVAKIGPDLSVKGTHCREIDVSQLIVSRGFIDTHVHLREPGFPDKETVKTGTEAAARGGYTSLYAMANTEPALDCPQILEAFLKLCKEQAKVRVYPVAAVSKGRLGEQLVDVQQLTNMGVRLFSDDGAPISDALIREALTTVGRHGGIVANHLEDMDLSGGQFHPEISSESEYRMLERDLAHVKATGCSYHAMHLSCHQSVSLISQAKAAGLPVTAEVTPHHLVVSTRDIKHPKGNYQMKPPLRSEEDRLALVEGLRNGVIDFIATDHAPHGREKELNNDAAANPFGVTGLETAFPVLYTKLVLPGLLSLEQLLACLTKKPAHLVGECEDLVEEGPADIVLIDLGHQQQIAVEEFQSKGTNSPFVGWSVTGWPVLTLVNGKVAFKSRRFPWS